MASIIEGLTGLIVGRGIYKIPHVSIDAEDQPDLDEKHRRWLLGKEKDRLRSLNPKRPMPMTLHAAMHRRSLNPEPPSSPSAPSLEPLAPCPSKGPQILMPTRHFSNVHSHYAGGPVHASSDLTGVSQVMRSYKSSHKDTSRCMGFNTHQCDKAVRRPPRKVTDLEQLPSLSSKLAKEIKQTQKVLEQAKIYAQIRKKQEGEKERKRRNSTAQQHPVPPFVLRTDKWYPSDSGNLVDALKPEITPPASPEPTGETSNQQSEEAQDVAKNPAPRPHVRWAPNLIQQRQKPLQVPYERQCLQPKPQRRRNSDRRPSNLRRIEGVTDMTSALRKH